MLAVTNVPVSRHVAYVTVLNIALIFCVTERKLSSNLINSEG